MFIEVFIKFMRYLCSRKCITENQTENGIRVQEIFHSTLEEVLSEAIQIPELYADAISIYTNYAKIDGINYLLPLPVLNK